MFREHITHCMSYVLCTTCHNVVWVCRQACRISYVELTCHIITYGHMCVVTLCERVVRCVAYRMLCDRRVSSLALLCERAAWWGMDVSCVERAFYQLVCVFGLFMSPSVSIMYCMWFSFAWLCKRSVLFFFVTLISFGHTLVWQLSYLCVLCAFRWLLDTLPLFKSHQQSFSFGHALVFTPWFSSQFSCYCSVVVSLCTTVHSHISKTNKTVCARTYFLCTCHCGFF